MDLQKKLAVWCVCLVLSACTATPTRVQQQMAPAQQQLIARDLVGVLVQIEDLSTGSTTLTVPAGGSDDDGFSDALKNRLEEVGYGIRTLGNGDTQELVNYSVETSVNEAGRMVSTYTLSVGRFGVRRGYERIDDVLLRPVGLMQVRGVNADGLRVDDALFANADNQAAAENLSSERLQVEVDVEPEVGAATIAETGIGAGIEAETDTETETDTDTDTGSDSSEMSSILASYSERPTRNYRDLEQSNFADLLSSYDMVEEILVLFGNDSLRLEQANKDNVRRLVSLFDPATDVFSVIGCSNGATSVSGGPKALALGRGERVKEELLYAGVPAENILFEGCWSEEYYDEKMPRRGVVLSLQRRVE